MRHTLALADGLFDLVVVAMMCAADRPGAIPNTLGGSYEPGVLTSLAGCPATAALDHGQARGCAC